MSCVAFDKERKILLQHTVFGIYKLATKIQICGVPLDATAKNIAELKFEYLTNNELDRELDELGKMLRNLSDDL